MIVLSFKKVLYIVSISLCILFCDIRLYAFFIQAFNISIEAFILIFFSGLIIVLSLIFMKSILNYINLYMYGFNKYTISFYLLTILLSLKFKKVILIENTQGVNISSKFDIIILIGAGLLLGAFLLNLTNCSLRLLKDLKKYKLDSETLIFTLILIAVLNISLALYLSNSCTIFFWDNAGFWETANYLSNLVKTNFFDVFKEAYYSVFTTDYNYFISIPISFLEAFLGKSRFVFLFGIINLYLIPFYIILFKVCQKYCNQSKLLSCLIILTCPYTIFIALIGFIDVGALIFTFSSMILYFNAKRSDNYKFFIIGVFLAISVILRRWYPFFVVSFIIAVIVDCIVYKKSIIPLIMICIPLAFILLYFFQPFVSYKLLTNYADLYSAYKMNLKIDYLFILRYFGLILLILNLINSILMILKNKNRDKVIFILIQLISCFVIFIKVQTHGQQHLLLYVPGFIILTLFLYANLLNKLKFKNLGMIVCICLSAICTLNTFVDRQQPKLISELNKIALFPNFAMKPVKRYDTREILALNSYLDNLSQNGQKKIAVIASSFTINPDILLKAEESLSIAIPNTIKRDYLLPMSDVDKRDGFSYNLFVADYIVVADPVQLHLGEQNQQVVVLPYNEFINNEGIAKAFKKLPQKFTLENDVNVYIYEKQRDITTEEKQALLNKFKIN